MPANYTRTINWTGQNTGSGANYSWEDVNGAEAQGWITRSNTSGDVWNFNISDNTASNAVTRTATYRVKHWTYTDGQDLNTWDEFTITQYASGTVEVTTTEATTTTTEATTTEGTQGTTTTTTLANNPTQATNATTIATNATAATTLATAATTKATGATAATTQATLAPAAGFLEDAYTDQPISTYSVTEGGGFNLYMHSNVPWRIELSNSNLINDGTTSGPPYTDAYDHELDFISTAAGTTLINLVDDTTGIVLDTVTVTIAATPIAKTITWNGSTATANDSGMALLKFVTIDSGSGSGQTLVYASSSSGAGAGKIYWSSDATGANQVAPPSWAQVDSITAFGTGSGVSSPDTSRVVITIDSYPAITTTSSGSGTGSGSGGIGIIT